jgi:Zn finger protein HypA/HybF involved in hydrogenase expression
MSLTKNQKRMQKERKRCNPENKCLNCGKNLKGSKHHFFCDDCYAPGLMYTQQIRSKIRFTKQGPVLKEKI